ncbi:E3 ubiquitin-protein ligase TRIM39-like [Pseudorasbora parva]|uniref:E3 ubiquitin-protein ligase TRIM39-like n=1 Tax=Pseudorasbora parva TaxID=51549 RepID=UPI00351F3C3D
MAESSSALPKPIEARRTSLDAPPLTLSSSSGPLAEELQCSICLDVFTDPVSTPCGHSFCKICLNQCWDNSQTYRCPLCKEPFSKRPDLKINTALREVVLLFKGKSGENKSEVLCDDPVENLEDYICQKHEKPLELFCRDDQTCVCLLCAVKDHKTHNTVPVEEESRERRPQLKTMQTDVQQMIQDRMKRIQDLKHSAKLKKETSEKEKAESIELFTDLIGSIERCQSELLEMMKQKQKAAEKQDEELIKELEQEITELKRRDAELEQLSHTEDHLHLLQIYLSLSRPAHTSSWTEISNDTHVSVETLRKTLIQLQETLDEKLNKTVELKRMQQYAVDVTLDPDTSYSKLILSDGGKQVAYGDIKLDLPDNPKQFDTCCSVLAKQGFSSGRFYFEVRVKGKTEWDLGVARESINRKGIITAAPENGYWTVVLRDGNHYKARESPSVSLSLRVKPQVVGVFVDYEEGLVSFYDVESRSLIYSFTGQSFTEKLYPYFSPGTKNKDRNSAPLIISHQIL